MQNDNVKCKIFYSRTTGVPNRNFSETKNNIFALSLIFCFIFLVFLFSCFLVLAPEIMAATNYGESSSDTNKYGLEQTTDCAFGYKSGTQECNTSARPAIAQSATDISTSVGTIIGAGLAFIGVLFFILMIYGGFLWMTAQGNEQQVEKAKNLIIAAIIGLVIVMSAYAITAYIGGTLTAS